MGDVDTDMAQGIGQRARILEVHILKRDGTTQILLLQIRSLLGTLAGDGHEQVQILERHA